MRFKAKADRIIGSERYYDHDGVKMIKGVNAMASAIIEAEQPFGPNYQTSLLNILNELWNTDKHQRLNFCVVYPQMIVIDYWPLPLGSGKVQQGFISVPPDVKHGTELFREIPRLDMEVKANVAMSGIIFDGGPVNGKQVSELLMKLVEFADRVVNALAQTVNTPAP
jgi:hypothetical protein